VDVYPPESQHPVRIELLGDTVESLREFDQETQRSVRPVDRVTLLPLAEWPRRQEVPARAFAGEHGPSSARTSDGIENGDEESLVGVFPGWEFRAMAMERGESNLLELLQQPVVLLDEPADLDVAAEEMRERWRNPYTEAEGSTGGAAPEVFALSDQEWDTALGAQQRLTLQHLELRDPKAAGDAAGVMVCQPAVRYHGNVAAFLAESRRRIEAREQVIVSAGTHGELERLAEIVRDAEIPFRVGDLGEAAAVSRLAEESPLRAPGAVPAITLIRSPIADGVVLPELRLALYGNADLFEALPARERARRRPKSAAFTSDLGDLKPGDFVVHVDHGIGRYEGLREVDTAGEFMLLTFAEEARLYVPLARMDLVQKYNSLGGATPALDRLGGTAWTARKARVRKSVAELADRLLRLYAERKLAKGMAFSPDTHWQREFEDAFEFEETPDQMRAIEEVKRDMEDRQPMDRLLCGDVGYGKTEVAMRAAFKAVADSKQVAVLAPTTVLAFQHWETFKRRMAAFPVRIELLSRFRTAAEQKQVLKDLEAGKVDVLIGTHRLLSKDVRFQDLGLLVVDEEQRFGVAHKERIKELRKEVDVLTMSATPIPRTLHMSLAGLRDMSVIETPPKDRLAIQTVVAPYSEGLVQRAIEEEMARGGQVFFVHNRIETIFTLGVAVQRLVPRARVLVGHGQMNAVELEKAMLKFVRHEADVLLSTTIIENGLDIPNCNTIIVDRADHMGLSELYQLRGRVGRSNVRAYAYLLVPPDAPLSGEARQRLAALREFSDLGAGFRIAALDLEMRGAGNMLGREQHGHIGAVGFDLYVQMLERAVAERKGEAPAAERRATINLGMDIRIPESYIPGENLRLATYKRIAGISGDAAAEEMRQELEDRFGPLPAGVRNLLEYAVLKGLAEQLQVATVERRGAQVAVRFHEQTALPPEHLVRVVRERRDLRLEPAGLLWMEVPGGADGALAALKSVLRQLQS
jgi:transcription-repair coupling factor (superfamily II helicase)